LCQATAEDSVSILIPLVQHVIMGYNAFQPIAGARVNVLCIPAGPITPERFQKFVKALKNAARIERKAVDATPSSGYIFYDISVTQDRERSHLFPFQTNSRCQVLLGLIDGKRLDEASGHAPSVHDAPSSEPRTLVEDIRARFQEQLNSEPGLTVRRLVCCGKGLNSDPDGDVLSLPDQDGVEAAQELMISISRQLLEGLTNIVNELKDKPISMVPGVGTLTVGRGGTTPTPASRSSTPVTSKPSSPMPNANGLEQQVMAQFLGQ
jgi:hypothetical protein